MGHTVSSLPQRVVSMPFDFALLRFTEDENIAERVYWYLCDGDLSAGDRVLAPVGSHNRLQLARVEKVLRAEEKGAPYQISLLKRVTAKYGARRIPLSFAKNCRELGGIRYGEKFFTRYNVFLRSDFPTDREDVKLLRNYGVNVFVDLREESERKEEESEISPIQCPLSGDPQCDYRELAESEGTQRALVELAAAQGCALFGCSAGKDRTGVIAAILLLLAGASDERVKDDFCLSYRAVGETRREVRERKLSSFFDAIGMRGGIEGYLADIGVGANTVIRLKQKLR